MASLSRRRALTTVCAMAAVLILRGALGGADAPPPSGGALPFISPIFGDNMVLQRGKPNTLWGWTRPGGTVHVDIEGNRASASAGSDGKWTLSIPVPPTGGPYTVKISGPQRLELHNVLVGDVWLCGGQSNMYLGVGATNNGAHEIETADHPDLRLFMVDHRTAYTPVAVPVGAWKVCAPQTLGEGGAGGFSAVAYYFARALQSRLHIPIGLIQDCVGGSPAESWMSGASLVAMGELRPQIEAMQGLRARGAPEYGSFLMHWLDEYDAGAKNARYAAPGLDDSSWKAVDVPGAFAELGIGGQPGVCWFRREVVLPDPLPAGAAKIFLGSIDKMDTTYVNGTWVGASSWVENPRAYVIASGILHPGSNLIAIRVFRTKPTDSFLSAPAVLRLQVGEAPGVALAGRWKAMVTVDGRSPRARPLDTENYATMPEVFYDGMIAPLAPLAITGAIWYQGEANTAHAWQYRKLLPGVIADWRALFRQGDFPFYIVSLPAFMAHHDEPTDDGWAELREAQALAARDVPHCGLAVTIDTGEVDNIHPKEKRVVGERLALCALSGHYRIEVPSSGPTYESTLVLPGALKLRFGNVDGGLIARDARLGEFSLAGEDRIWHWTDARIDGDSVVVSSASVPKPVAARYAWQANPAATLGNAAGLPAGPFRTDDWPFPPP
jgi:sialate O-acetylesterase